MTGHVQLLTGIPGTGKTSSLIAQFREELQTAQQAGKVPRALWLSPTRRACHSVRAAVLQPPLSIAVNLQILTFDRFAERVLHGAPRPVKPITATVQRLLLRRIVDRLLEQGQLTSFGGIARTPGFLDQVAGFIAELKVAEIWPENLAEALGPQLRRRDRELGQIYTAYQQLLLDRHLYDIEGRFWWARQTLRDGHWGSFAELSTVYVDGFSDFTTAQYDILDLLVQRAHRVCLSLDTEHPALRTELFRQPLTVRERLHERWNPQELLFPRYDSPDANDADAIDAETLAPATSTPATSTPATVLPAVATITRKLFQNPRDIVKSADSTGLEVLAAAGQLGEVQLLATKIKQLLLAGVRPGEITVCVRSLADYGSLIGEVFSEAGLPCFVDERLLLGRSPLLKGVLAVLQLEAENWPFRQLVSLLDSSYFQPHWKEYAYGSGVRDVARVLRKMKLAEQREIILASLKRVIQKAEPDEPDGQDFPTQARFVNAAKRAEALLLRLSDELQPLREAHPFADWVTLVISLGERLGMARFQPPPAHRTATDLQRDRQAWEAFKETLFNAAHAAAIWDRSPTLLSLSEFLAELTDLMQRQGVGRVAAEEGQIRVLEAAQVRNLDIPYLFVAGLTERGFPQQHSEGCLFDDEERRNLNGRGWGVHHRESRSAEEMLLFYSVVTRARCRLTLSYPAMSTDGDPLSPSPYLLAVEDLFDSAGLQKTLEEQLDPVPPADRILAAADLRVRAMQEALDRRPELFGALCQTPQLTASGLNIVAAVDAAVERFHLPEFSPYEGWLQNPHSRNSLQEWFAPEHEFSATQLEAYASCPFRFFLRYVLRIQPLETLDLQDDAGERGTLVHEILAELHRELSAENNQESPGDLIGQRFHDLLSEKLGRRPASSEVQAALAVIEQRILEEWGAAYGEQWDHYQSSLPDDLPLRPVHFEVPFGTPRAATEHAEEPTTAPLIFGQGTETVRVGGRIDRIDVGTHEGQQVFVIVDYKTGSNSAFDQRNVEEGTALQLALYTLAAERLGLTGPGARPFQMGYWQLRNQGFIPGLKSRRKKGAPLPELVETVWEGLQELLDSIIPRLAAGIRRGQFPVFNRDPKCTQHCAYQTVCRVGQVRALPERMKRTWVP